LLEIIPWQTRHEVYLTNDPLSVTTSKRWNFAYLTQNLEASYSFSATNDKRKESRKDG